MQNKIEKLRHCSWGLSYLGKFIPFDIDAGLAEPKLDATVRVGRMLSSQPASHIDLHIVFLVVSTGVGGCRIYMS